LASPRSGRRTKRCSWPARTRRPTREEVETVNEEFQATNEELETSMRMLTAKRRGAAGRERDLATAHRRAQCQAGRARAREVGHSGGARSSPIDSGSASATPARGSRPRRADHERPTTPYDRFFGGAEAGDRARGCRRSFRFRKPTDRSGRAAEANGFRMEFRGDPAWGDAGAVRGRGGAGSPPGDRTWGGVLTIRDLSGAHKCGSAWALDGRGRTTSSRPRWRALHGYLQLGRAAPSAGELPRKPAIYAARATRAEPGRSGEPHRASLDVSPQFQAGPTRALSPPRSDLLGGRFALPSRLPRRCECIDDPGLDASWADPRPGGMPGRLQQVFVQCSYPTLSSTRDVRPPSTDRASIRIGRGWSEGPRLRARHSQPCDAAVVPAITRLGSKPSTGLGLGLSTWARDSWPRMAGPIEAESILGEGTGHRRRRRSARGELGAMRLADLGGRNVIRLAIIEDHPAIARGGSRRLLGGEPDQ